MPLEYFFLELHFFFANYFHSPTWLHILTSLQQSHLWSSVHWCTELSTTEIKCTMILFITEYCYSKTTCCIPTRFWWHILISCQKCVQRQGRDGAYLCVVGGGVLRFAEHLPVPGCAASSADSSRAHAFLGIGDAAVFKCDNFSSNAFHQVGEDGFSTMNLKIDKLWYMFTFQT